MTNNDYYDALFMPSVQLYLSARGIDNARGAIDIFTGSQLYEIKKRFKNKTEKNLPGLLK